MKGIYLTAPHGEWIVTGKKNAIIKAKPLPDECIGVEVYLCSDKLVYGILTLSRPQEISVSEFEALKEMHQISTDERKKWWPEQKEFLMYSFELHEIFTPPKSFTCKPGTQTMLEEIQIEKEETSTADRLGRMNSPTFAYMAVYGKVPEQWISGRTDYPEKPYKVPGRDVAVTIDEHLKPEWFDALNSIDELEIRASCEGHDAERVAYIVFRLRQENDAQAEEVSRRLNEVEGIYSRCDIGTEGRPRIVVAGKTWYGQDDWSSWWEELPMKISSVMNEVGLEKGVRQAFGSPGGKKILAAKICAYIPEHKVYCEPFMGGGAVFFRKKPSEVEVINDKDSEIAFAYRFMKGLTEEDLDWLKRRSWKVTRMHFEQVKGMQPKDDRERFYKFLFLSKASYGGVKETVNTAKLNEALGPPDYLKGAKERLQGVSIYNKDYKEVLKAHDSKETFFYLDPPYPGKEQFKDMQIDARELRDICRKLRGKFILSLPTSLSKEFSEFHQLKVKTSGQFQVGGTWKKTRFELLVSNFPLKSEFKYIEKEECIEEISFEKGIRPAFGSPGGKRMLATKISTYIPKHGIYCEPFIGGGAVLFKKDPSDIEVINDKDPEIAFAYKFMKNVTDEQIKQLKRFNWKPDEGTFKRLLEKEPKDDVERFRKHIYLQQWSVGGLKERFSGGGEWNYSDYPKTISQYEKYKERLQNVQVFNQDYSKIIEKFDSKDTFFYFDPPYKSHWMGEDFSFDEEEFKECLKKLKGKFILSYSVEGKELFKDFKSKEVKTEKHIIGKPKGVRTELLISNFSLEPLYKYISKELVEESDDLEKGVRPAFGSPGGKKFLARRIASYIPKHKVYAELFVGGGAVFFAKEPSEVEIINDKESEIAFAYKFIRGITEDQISQLRRFKWIGDEKYFRHLKDHKPISDIERFHKFLYLRRCTRQDMKSFRYLFEGQDMSAAVDRLPKLKERLKNVQIDNEDFFALLKKHDSKETFFYLDPPYPSSDYPFTHKVETSRIKDALKDIKGKFILSYEDTPEARKAFKHFEIKTVQVKRWSDVPNGFKIETELLISNFPLKPLYEYISKELVEEADDLEKGVRQAFGSPAGKTNLAERIIRLIPEHRVYVEPFIGGGAVLFRKLPSEIEVINDKDSEIAFCFKYIQNLTDERIEKLKKFNWISSRSKWQTLLNANDPANDEERIYNFIYSLKGSFSLSRRSYRPAAEGQSLIPNFDAWLGVKERIKDVKIYAQDYKPIIEKFDSKDTFFYLDPPYPSEWTGPVQDGKEFDLNELAEVLKKIKGKFIFSIDKSAKNRKLFDGFDFRTIRRKTFFNRPDQRDDPKHVEVDVEYLISNFPLKTENKYIEKDFVEEGFVKQKDSYMLIPDEDKVYRYVIQTHFRGKTAHRDFRIESGDKAHLIGWTLADMVAGTIKELVTTMALAKKYDAKSECWKIDFNKGKFKLRRTRAGNLVPAEIRAFEKAKEPKAWLNVSGVTKPWPAPGSTKEYPGVFTIVDKGICEYGAQKPDFHEYFLHGKLKGRLCIRKITRGQFKKEYGIDEIIERILPPGKLEEAGETETSFWVAVQPLDQKPYVISERAVQKKWMPPVGISALPIKVKQSIRPKYWYWRKVTEVGANEVRDNLVDAISSGKMAMK